MRITLVATAAALLTQLPAIAQESTDPRALEACQTDQATFVQIADCLPDAHVSVKVLDAFQTIYPPEAQPLKDRCLELNESKPLASATCVTEAVRSAIKLKASLPKNAALEDPIFNAVSDPALLTELEEAEASARKTFPDKLFWGGAVYQAYR